MTLSQIALARHLAVSVRWIRKQGEIVTWRGERWFRLEFQNGRLAGYKLTEVSNDI